MQTCSIATLCTHRDDWPVRQVHARLLSNSVTRSVPVRRAAVHSVVIAHAVVCACMCHRFSSVGAMSSRANARSPLMSASLRASDSDVGSGAEASQVSVRIGGRNDDEVPSVTLHQAADDDEETERKEPQRSPVHYSSTVGALSPDPPKSPKGAGGSSSSGNGTGSIAVQADDEALREDFLKVARMDGYEFSYLRECAWWIACLGSAFSLWLLAQWFPSAVIPWRYRSVPLKVATMVHVTGRVHGAELVPVQELGSDLPPESETNDQDEERTSARRKGSMDLLHNGRPGRMIIWRHMRFIYSPSADQFLIQQSDVVSKRPEALETESRHTSVANLRAKDLTERLRVGLEPDQVRDNRILYGENQLVLRVPSITELLLGEILEPFYVFQAYSVTLWGFEAYWYYAGAIILIAGVSIVQTLIETRRRMEEMASLARFDAPVDVLRSGGKVMTISSTQLVPGDIVRIATGVLPCDLALLSGGGVVVNESMLTGESVPVVKSPVVWPANKLGDGLVSLATDARHTLFSATRVLQLKPSAPGAPVWGVVIRTGFATTKGALLLSILYPAPSSFAFVQQSYKFICALFALSLLGFGLSVWQLKVVQDASDSVIVIRALDLITIVVPPSLPLALTVGTNFALLWLRQEKIFCISPSRIPMAGKVKLMAFDKTGTLTEESLEFAGVLAAEIHDEDASNSSKGSDESTQAAARFGKFQSPHSRLATMGLDSAQNGSTAHEIESSTMSLRHDDALIARGDEEAPAIEEAEEEEELSGLARETDTRSSVPLSPALKVALACCQSLANMDGSLIGDPLEVQTFQAAGGELLDSGELQGFQQIVHVRLPPGRDHAEQQRSYGVETQFEFSSALQRMSVLVRELPSASSSGSSSKGGAHQKEGRQWAFVKGSPEMMESLCIPSSLPASYRAVLGHFARKGFRVLAIARRHLPSPPPLREGGIPMEKTDLRAWVERDLTFLGLVLLANAVKPESAPTLHTLQSAAIRCVMITGDNPLTAVTVARECGLVGRGVRIFQAALVKQDDGETSIEWRDTDNEQHMLDPLTLKLPPSVRRALQGGGDASASAASGVDGAHTTAAVRYELALTGPSFSFLHSLPNSDAPGSLFHRAVLNAQIGARFSPDQKAAFVSTMQGMGIYTGFCGDGANDVGALKTSHVGISLSESEASIAAPFTYARPNISCVPIVLAEGRSSLVTSFQLFRFMALYSMIQFGAVILTYFQGSVFGNWQYLFEDLFVVFPLTIFMGATRASRSLSVKRPSGDLLSRGNVLNLLVHMGIVMAFQLAVYTSIASESGYTKLDNPDNGPRSYQTTALYYFSNFAYVVIAVLFSQGFPWKRSIFSNIQFSLWCLVALGASAALLCSPLLEPAFFREDDVPMAWSWRKMIGMWVLLYAFAAIMWDRIICPVLVQGAKKCSRRGMVRGLVFGRPKVFDSKHRAGKLYHKMRGEFEAGWKDEHVY